MMKLLNKFVKDERGIVGITAFAIAFPLVLLFLAYGIDFGRIYILKHELQSAVDAAALAGASITVVQYVVDEAGNPNSMRTVIDEEKAGIAAAGVLDANISVQGIKTQAKILSTDLHKVDDRHYYACIVVETPTFLVGPIGAKFFHDDSLKVQKISRFAVAKVADP